MTTDGRVETSLPSTAHTGEHGQGRQRVRVLPSAPVSTTPGAYTTREVAAMVLANLAGSSHPRTANAIADDLDLTWHTVKDGLDYLDRAGQIVRTWDRFDDRGRMVYGFRFAAKAAA